MSEPQRRPASLSVCTIAYNEADLIGPMLASVAHIADEIVLGVDTRTTDRTGDIADDYWARIVAVDWCDDFSYARNLTLEAATADWILVLDADERLTPEGSHAIREVLRTAPPQPAEDAITAIAFLMGQHDLDGTLHAVEPTAARLFRNRPEIRYRGVVHEEVWWTPDPSRTSVMLVSGCMAITHVGYDPQLWRDRGKYERNIRLLEQRVAADPSDSYARSKLTAQRAAGGPWIDANTSEQE